MLVIARIASRHLAGPIQRKAHAFKLAPHGSNVCICPYARMRLHLLCGVFSRQAEGIPSHRMQNIKAARTTITRNHITHGIIAHMPHVYATGRIGKHL